MPGGGPALPMKRSEVAQVILAITTGVKPRVALRAAGFPEGMVRAIMKHPEFLGWAAEARAKFVQDRVAAIVAAEGEDWKAAAWMLERTMPEEYGRKDKVEVKATVTALPWRSSITGEVIEAKVEEPGKGGGGES